MEIEGVKFLNGRVGATLPFPGKPERKRRGSKDSIAVGETTRTTLPASVWNQPKHKPTCQRVQSSFKLDCDCKADWKVEARKPIDWSNR